MNKLICVLLLLVLTSSVTSQTIQLENYKIEIREVIQKKSISSLGQLMFPKGGMIYLGLDAEFSPNKKGELVQIDDIKVVIDEIEYPFMLAVGHGAFSVGKGRSIKLKKTKKKKIYAEVPKESLVGKLYFKNKLIGFVEIKEENKTGTFKKV